MHLFSRFLDRGLVLVELRKNRAASCTLIALNEERIFQWHGCQVWPVLHTMNLQRWLNCLPPSLQLSAKDITSWEPLPWGSAGAAGSTHKHNVKQKIHKVTSSDWLRKQLWEAQTSLFQTNKQTIKPWGLLRLHGVWTQGTKVHSFSSQDIHAHVHVMSAQPHSIFQHLLLWQDYLYLWNLICLHEHMKIILHKQVLCQKLQDRIRFTNQRDHFLSSNRHPWSGNSRTLITTEKLWCNPTVPTFPILPPTCPLLPHLAEPHIHMSDKGTCWSD